jgi:hypothetical protein
MLNVYFNGGFMKHLLVFAMMLFLAAPALAFSQNSECGERQTDLFMEADAILIYNSQFSASLNSVKKVDRKHVTAEFQEDVNRRVVELEKANDQFVADCVQ